MNRHLNPCPLFLRACEFIFRYILNWIFANRFGSCKKSKLIPRQFGFVRYHLAALPWNRGNWHCLQFSNIELHPKIFSSKLKLVWQIHILSETEIMRESPKLFPPSPSCKLTRTISLLTISNFETSRGCHKLNWQNQEVSLFEKGNYIFRQLLLAERMNPSLGCWWENL